MPTLQVLAAREPDSIQDAARTMSTPALVLAAHEDNFTHDEVSSAEARCQLLKLRRALAQYLLAEVMAGEGKLMYPARWGDAGQQALPTLLGRQLECLAPSHQLRSQLGRGRSCMLRVLGRQGLRLPVRLVGPVGGQWHCSASWNAHSA